GGERGGDSRQLPGRDSTRHGPHSARRRNERKSVWSGGGPILHDGTRSAAGVRRTREQGFCAARRGAGRFVAVPGVAYLPGIESQRQRVRNGCGGTVARVAGHCGAHVYTTGIEATALA